MKDKTTDPENKKSEFFSLWLLAGKNRGADPEEKPSVQTGFLTDEPQNFFWEEKCPKWNFQMGIKSEQASWMVGFQIAKESFLKLLKKISGTVCRQKNSTEPVQNTKQWWSSKGDVSSVISELQITDAYIGIMLPSFITET